MCSALGKHMCAASICVLQVYPQTCSADCSPPVCAAVYCWLFGVGIFIRLANSRSCCLVVVDRAMRALGFDCPLAALIYLATRVRAVPHQG